MSSSSPPCEARQLILPKLLHTFTPHLSSLLYDPKSSSLAFHYFDSSFSLYPCVNPLCLSHSSTSKLLLNPPPPFSSRAPPLSVLPHPPSSASTFCGTTISGKINLLSSHRDLEWDQSKGGMVFKTNHGVSMKLSGGINVLSLYSVSNSKIWVFALRLIADHGVKCPVIDCCFPIFESRVLFGFLILGEENGVRVSRCGPWLRVSRERRRIVVVKD